MATTYRDMAKTALNDLYQRFWTKEDGGHLLPTHCGLIVKKPLMIWETATMLFAMEMYYEATGDKETRNKILNSWAYICRCFTDKQMTGNFGQCPNLALDDTGWDCMTYILIHRICGDSVALDRAKRCLLGAYEHWKDGDDCTNGLWYNDRKQYAGDHWKSSYIVSLLISALEYLRITEGTPAYSSLLHQKTMELIEWTEKTLCRDQVKTYPKGLQDGSDFTVNTVDFLYWTDYNVDRENRAERNGPDGGLRPNGITDNGSVSALFANMGMAAVNAELYRTTQTESFLTRALTTARSMSTIYNSNGAFINDRDPYTNGTMLRYYIHNVLTLPGITPDMRKLVFTTADNIFENGQRNRGIYSSCWQKADENGMIPSVRSDSASLMINATSVSMICGAALIESLGLATE